MKEKIKIFLINSFKQISNFIQNLYLNISQKIKVSFKKCKEGEENLNILLIYWCVIPCILYLFILKFTNCKFILNIIDLFMLILTLLDLYFISKTLKIHPEYNTELMRELEKQNYYKTLDEKQLKEEKLKEKKDNTKKFFYKLLALKNSEKTDIYKIVKCFVILILLVVLKRIFL